MTPATSKPPLSPTPSRPDRGAAFAAQAPSLVEKKEGGGTRVLLAGDLTVRTLPAMEKRMRSLGVSRQGAVIFDLGGLVSLDTAGALLINRTVTALQGRGLTCRFENSGERWDQLLAKSVPPVADETKSGQNEGMLHASLAGVGKTVVESVNTSLQLTGFLGLFLVTLVNILRKPASMRWTSLVFQMDQVGLKAVPIVGLLTFLIGLVVAYMGAQQLSMFGADVFAVNLLEVTVMREMAVLITSIVVAGRSSSSFTAQIGAMVANEEVDALRSMGLDPNLLLVMPRVIALMLCLPMLVFIADIMALAGGWVALKMTIHMGPHAFITQLGEVASIKNFMVGMIKTPFFAMAIGLVGCFQGFRATGSAESVGFLTTISVVQAIFIVILLDALFAIFFTTLGI